MRMTGSWKLMVGMVATAAALGASAAPAAAATVYNVNTTADGNLATSGSTTCATSSDSAANGKCSLRAAIEAAQNVLAGNVTINVPKGTYKLTIANAPRGATCQGCGLISSDTELFVAGNSDNPSEVIAIDGAGAKSTIVDANYTDRAFEIAGGTTASISGLTIEHGRPGGLGAATKCPAQGTNPPTAPGGGGGGILDNGVLTLSGDVVTDNLVPGYGGGIDNEANGALHITGTTISDNYSCDNGQNSNLGGGGLSNDNGAAVSIVGSTIKYNTVQSPGDGGGVGDDNFVSGADFTIARSTISHNVASSGAGVAAESGGTFHLFADLISHNHASNNGGAIFNDGPDTVTYVDTTIADNSASNNGGGLFSCGTDTFQFSTVSDNSAGSGVGNLSTGGECPGIVTLDNTIVIRGIGETISFSKPAGAGTSSAPPSNCSVFGFTDNGYNMFDDTQDSGAQCGSSSGDHDVITANPKVGTLADNLGPTRTEALLKGSPALDAANDTACVTETKDAQGKPVDQRFISRPQGPHCDIGAYEANPNLGLGGSASQSPIFVGQQDTITDVIHNDGVEQADNTIFTDPAAGYKIDSVTPSQGTCTHTATTVTCHLGTVPAGGKVTIKIVLTGLTPGTITLKGKVTSSGFDPTPGNNRHNVKIKVKARSKPPKPARPTVSVASLGSACYRESSTFKVHVKAGAAAGIRTLSIKVAGRTVKTYTFTSHSPKHKSVTVHVHASTLTPGRSYTVSAKVTDTLARSASASRPVKICKHHNHHGFTG